MDVRCEKCQTEYELDEARLKPGGVTVKCTNCGHMFKIRKRTPTNVGAPPVGERTRPTSSKPPMGRADSILADVPRATTDSGSGPTAERQWLIRLETGEQRSCRELAILQQWIIAGIVTRESLISRTGKTWKRLGDVIELGQYFVIADEARQNRQDRATPPNPRPVMAPPAYPPTTMPGVGAAKAAGGTILPDDDDLERTTGSFTAARQPPQPPARPAVPPVRTPPMGSPAAPRTMEQPTVRANYEAPTARAPASYPEPASSELPSGFGGPPQPAPEFAKPAPNTAPKTGPAATAQTEVLPPAAQARPRPITQPPPPPQPQRKTQLASNQPMPQPASNRATATWATDGIRPSDPSDGDGPSFGGRLAAIPDEPAFMAGRVRVEPGDERSFETGKVRFPDDDDDLVPSRRGSGAGKWIAIVALLVMVAAAGVIYMVIRQPSKEVATKPPARDAAVAMAPDAAPVVTPIPDAAAPPPDPLEVARGELLRDDEARLKTALTSLDGKDEPEAQALRAQLATAIAQGLIDRAGLLADKAEADKLRKDAKTIVVEAAPLAQKALKAKPDDAAANLAMAEVLRLQGKSARDVKRYLDAARAKADVDRGLGLGREIALADALVLARDGKLEDAKTNLAAIDQGDGKLEKSGDVRPRYHLALVAFAQGKPTDAKPLVEQILAAQPEHPGARALATRLETAVAKTDPLPPEDGPKDAGVKDASVTVPPKRNPDVPVITGGESYDRLLAQGNALSEKNCTKAMDFYAKALEQKPNGVEALTGMGYCHIDRKEFASAQSKFRAALAVSSRYEPALFGVAEAYAQQGRKEDAINSFKAYLDVYPNSAKAKKRLEMLGVGADSGTSPGSAAPPPPPPPPAGSAAPPAGAGSGSG